MINQVVHHLQVNLIIFRYRNDFKSLLGIYTVARYKGVNFLIRNNFLGALFSLYSNNNYFYFCHFLYFYIHINRPKKKLFWIKKCNAFILGHIYYHLLYILYISVFLQLTYRDITSSFGLMEPVGEGRPLLTVQDLENRLVFTKCKVSKIGKFHYSSVL